MYRLTSSNGNCSCTGSDGSGFFIVMEQVASFIGIYCSQSGLHRRVATVVEMFYTGAKLYTPKGRGITVMFITVD